MIADIVIENARLLDGEGIVHIGITDGLVSAIADSPINGAERIDASGNLVTAPFANAHMHLDKVYTWRLIGDDAVRRYSEPGMADARDAIMLAAGVKQRYSREGVQEHARQALREAVRHGVLHVRAFADIDPVAELKAVSALLALREEFADTLDLQVVAFPQDGIVMAPGTAELLREAMALGADVVGGIPWIEEDTDAMAVHIDTAMMLAAEFDKDVAMLVDDSGDPALCSTEMLAQAAVSRGWQGRVSACHARALAVYDEERLSRVLAAAQQARMTFVANPHTGPLCLPIPVLAEAGLTVALGQDDIEDAYYPYGRHNMLEVAFLTSHVLHRYTKVDMRMFFDMVTRAPARILGAAARGPVVGHSADLVVLDGPDVQQALLRHNPPRYVLRGGAVVAATTESTVFY